MKIRLSAFLLAVALMPFHTVLAQSFSGDARKIAMGGIGYSENITAEMIEEERQYSSIVIPIGLIPLIQNRDRFDPHNDDFDPLLGMEYIAHPLHYVFGRESGGVQGDFVSDILNAKMKRDLNAYRGFVLTDRLVAEGLANPQWGKTFKLRRQAGGSFHGVYVGAGPYLSARTDLSIDKSLADLLASATPVSIPNRKFSIGDDTTGQLALDVAAGYRGRFALPGRKNTGKSARDGIYVGVNYHYLHGFRYENSDISIQLDTDANGLLTINPMTSPLTVDYYNSRSGSGYALDFGIGAVVDRWEFGFGANGVANRIDWNDLTLKRFTLQNILEGAELVGQRLPVASPDLRMELPVQYIGNVGYHEAKWSAVAEVSRGFQGTSFHGGAEYRLGAIEFRGGARYGLERWHPSGGIGINLTRRFSVDVAAFGTTLNIARELRPGVALSLRLNQLRD